MKGAAELLSLIELRLNLFWFYFTGENHSSKKEGRKPEYLGKIPDNQLQKMANTKAQKIILFHIHTQTHVCECIFCMSLHTHTKTHTHTHTYTRAHAHAHTHTCTRACTHIQTHTHMSTHKSTHTHTHARAMMIMIMIMIITFKGAIRDFLHPLAAPRTVSSTHAQVARAQSCANHVQHIERSSRASVMLRATWYEGTAQLLSLTELKLHLFEL